MPICLQCHRERSTETANQACPYCGSTQAAAKGGAPPARSADDPLLQFTRYHSVRKLGAGSFGVVYEAIDEELRRRVAVKVLHARLLSSFAATEAFLNEARILAGLDHPGIVPVYDVGTTVSGQRFIVSKLIDGIDLRTRIREGRVPLAEAVEIVRHIALALHHAHERRLIHRDVKPSNVLLVRGGDPVLIDFGLALREEDVGRGPGFVGTVTYMSPEQARNEGHLVDARSDLYSLGVILYELLAGRRPFQTSTRDEMVECVATCAPPSPREFDEGIPPELERVCLKAIAFRASDRHHTARALADDLERWQASCRAGVTDAGTRGPAPVVPRGLRSFDTADAGFFLRLLPGPHTPEGLPESVAFWIHRLDRVDPDDTFRVGLLYGPSGCGKTSLVKAGVLPRLDTRVMAIYVEATPDETEANLLHQLRRKVASLPGELSLADAFAWLRRGAGAKWHGKIVVLLDQFEQWLHRPGKLHDTELLRALRQCDGGALQALLMVRDDFWLPVSRFLRELEVPVHEGRNAALVDLFDNAHARRVLAECGRALGRLPDDLADCSSEQQQFLDEAVGTIAEDGRVIPVRLSILVELVKHAEWVPATLRARGGAEGLGEAFLEEAFRSSAPLARRQHEKAARAVLQALLPEGATEIKGHSRSRSQLRGVAEYDDRPADFAALLQMLDQDLRLVTPTTPIEGAQGTQPTEPMDPEYQLTHDFLVPSIRGWLTRGQRETRRGRAELLLTERAAEWNTRPESRNLPTWTGWASIRLFTRRERWNASQQKMMAAADRLHLRRTTLNGLAAVLLVIGALVLRSQFIQVRDASRADALVAEIQNAEHFPPGHLEKEVARYEPLVVPRLQTALQQKDLKPREQIHLRLALLPYDHDQVDALVELLLKAPATQVGPISRALMPHKPEWEARLWAFAQNPLTDPEVLLRAASALSAAAPDDPRWATVRGRVVAALTEQNLLVLDDWIDALRAAHPHLLPELAAAFRSEADPARKIVTTDLLAAYAEDRPDMIADLLLDADPRQFSRLWPVVQKAEGTASKVWRLELRRQKTWDAPNPHELTLYRRQAQAGVALLRLGHTDDVWPLFRHRPPLDVRSYLIHRLAPLGVDARVLLARLRVEPDASARRALLLAIGEYEASRLPEDERQSFVTSLMQAFHDEPDPGIRAAGEWVLRRWGHGDRLAEALAELTKSHAGARVDPARPWWVNGQGQTFVRIPAPAEFMMGSPESEAGRKENETYHRQRIARPYAIATREVTVAQYLRFDSKYHPVHAGLLHEPQRPVVNVTWFEAMRYCRWLSEKEGIPEEEMCYPPLAQIKPGMKVPPEHRERTGYRLPTEPEWEYACRSDSASARYYGRAPDLLGNYAWYIDNSRANFHIVGLLKPNDWGLFDMYGNADEWTGSAYHVDESGREASADGQPIEGQVHLCARGGALDNYAMRQRSAARRFVLAEDVLHRLPVGIRLVRTCR